MGMGVYVYLPRHKPTDTFTLYACLKNINAPKSITNTPKNNQKRFQGDFSFLYLTGYLRSFKSLSDIKAVYHQKPHTIYCYFTYKFMACLES